MLFLQRNEGEQQQEKEKEPSGNKQVRAGGDEISGVFPVLRVNSAKLWRRLKTKSRSTSGQRRLDIVARAATLFGFDSFSPGPPKRTGQIRNESNRWTERVYDIKTWTLSKMRQMEEGDWLGRHLKANSPEEKKNKKNKRYFETNEVITV